MKYSTSKPSADSTKLASSWVSVFNNLRPRSCGDESNESSKELTAQRRQRLWLPFLSKYLSMSVVNRVVSCLQVLSMLFHWWSRIETLSSPHLRATKMIHKTKTSQASPPYQFALAPRSQDWQKLTSSMLCPAALRSGLPEPSVSASLKSRLISLTNVVEKKDTISSIGIAAFP